MCGNVVECPWSSRTIQDGCYKITIKRERTPCYQCYRSSECCTIFDSQGIIVYTNNDRPVHNEMFIGVLLTLRNL